MKVVRVSLLVVTCACIGAACGDAGTATSATTVDDSTSPAATTSRDPVARPVARPARRALGTSRRLELLVAAYAPVSERISFVVAAHTLWNDAVATKAGDDVERARAGALRVELARMSRVLGSSRTNVAAAAVESDDQRRIQELMLRAIDARARAVRQLDEVLDAAGRDAASKTELQSLEAAHRQSWDQSLRAAREAMTLLQATRAAQALDPAQEESIR